MAEQAATQKVIGLAKEEDEGDLVSELERMHQQAAETEERCTDLGREPRRQEDGHPRGGESHACRKR
jgi:hypothetical protein